MKRQRTSVLKATAANLVTLLASAVLSLLAAEAAVRLFDLFPRARTAADPVMAPSPSPGEPAFRRVLHPFRGWAGRPDDGSAAPPGGRPHVNLFGFRSFERDYRKLEESDFVIGIFGGSVALGIANQGREALIRTLEEELPEHAGSIRLAVLAVGGYKQPQQLFLLAEMLLLGVPLDVAVNIDGFNEVALGSRDGNREYHPLFPYRSYWETLFHFASGSLSEAQIGLTAKILELKARARSLRDGLARRPRWGRSQLVRAVVGSLIVDAERRAAVTEERLGEVDRDGGFEATARIPDPCLGKRYACWPVITSIWRQSSEMMRVIAKEAGVTYVHVLQPSQYVDGSKTLTEEERANAYDLQHRWSRGARLGYPHLRTAGRELRAAGIDFHDLTMIFRDHEETIYSDTCCHFNRSGYRIVAETVARLIGEAVGGPGRSPP